MKKTKKALASLAIASMILSTVPFNAFAAGTVPTRLSGNTAAQTAVAIADQTGWTGTAILASSASYGMVDALTAGPLASYLKAPILLTGAESTLDAATKAELVKLNVTKVYVTSGTAVIKQSVLDELVAMGITVTPLGGIDRAATSVNIASKMVGVTKVAIANGLQDALSIAAIASAANEPILLTDKDALPASVKAFLTANPGITSSDVIGGTGIISDAVKAALPSAMRHAGNTAYDTNNQCIQDFASSLKFDNVYVASGVSGIDALAGAPLAAQTKSAIVLTNGTVPATATFVYGKLATGAVVTALGGTAVVPEAVRVGVATGVVTPPTGTLSVTSVSAVSATSFKVVFNQAPSDTSKVTFDVKRATTPVTTTATWNTAKTEATVTSSTNLPEGSYTVAVKDGNTDLGTSTVSVTAQKIAKINITSTKLGVTNVTTGTGIGYATYNVMDQYGNDVTSQSIANSLTFQSGVGTVTGRDGILKVTPTMNLLQFSSVVITVYDSTSGVSTSATLTVSTQVGTLSDIKLSTLTNVDNKVLTAGDTSSLFYITYTATDISGNPTTDLDMVKNGLILNALDQLTTSSSYVTAKVVADPANTAKAAIQVQVANGIDISMDMPIVITAMTYTGKTSSINATLKKAAAVDSFVLMAPAFDIAAGDTAKTIPFTALDQNGVAITKASDLTGVTLSPNLTRYINVDGSLSVKFLPGSSTGSQVLTAMTPTGKYSSVTINVQKAAVADKLAIDSSAFTSIMQATVNTGTASAPVYTQTTGAAVQVADFGWDNGGLSVKDQYGRTIDMTSALAASNRYKVVASSSDETVVSTAGDFATTMQREISLTSLKPGSATVSFKLYNTDTTNADGSARDNTVAVNTQSLTFTVVANSDIKDYIIDTVADAIYTASTSGSAITASQYDYKANPKVYGTTASGAKVLLAGTPVIGASVDSSDFTVFTGTSASSTAYTSGAVSYKAIKVSAKKFSDSTKTASSTNLALTILGADGKIYAKSTAIKSTTVAPTAVSIGITADTSVLGIFVPAADTVKLVASGGNTYATMLGTTLAKYNASGAESNVYIAPKDQYGKTGSLLSQFVVVTSGTTLVSGSTINVLSDGTITGTAMFGDVLTVSGVTTNGLVKTLKLEFK